MSYVRALAAIGLGVLLLGAVTRTESAHHLKRAVCVLVPTAGNSASGIVTFEETGNGVRVKATLTGLSPGKHGFHIHEFGNLSVPDGTGCGGHYNPAGNKHGLPPAPAGERHAGDLGNIEADAFGRASYERVDKVITLSGEGSILGRGMIVHAQPDDGGQPTGNAGARVAMGVIGHGSAK